ncbi:MAG TPA: BTAD domain-containing putative transcriptional regulator [Candidatus Limnocylindrales bacterium]|nr:BTAD domain-containing putative transcriptional regulator [Candidatus Limnocylindrales bacterium]
MLFETLARSLPSYKAMRVLLLTLATTLALAAADERQLALALQAQTEFDRVELAPVPRLQDAGACEQSQAALLPVASKAEVPLIHYRKGYCTLVSASLTGVAARYNDAAAEFQKAIDAWPDRSAKNATPEPVPSGLSILVAIARLKAAPTAETLATAAPQIAAAESAPVCPASFMPEDNCRRWMNEGKAWLGWAALRSDKVAEAYGDFAAVPNTGWTELTSGRQAFAAGNYAAAASSYSKALEIWRRSAQNTAPSMYERMAPLPDMTNALADLGGAQLLSGDARAAIATLDQAVKASAANARALYLRALAKEKSGDEEGALADYNLASRTAFAGAQDLASGEAHLYRGVLLYRRKDYHGAEDEFASALNFDIAAPWKADAAAWHHMAAVAAGGCDTSRQLLGEALKNVSPYFPKAEARSLMETCPSTTSARARQ